jgi:hypothetical protein
VTVGPTDLVGVPHDLLKTFQKIPQTTYSRTTSRLGVQDKTSVDFDQSRSTDNGNCCKQLDLGLLVVTDMQSSSDMQLSSAGQYKLGKETLVPVCSPQAIYTDHGHRVLLSGGPN